MEFNIKISIKAIVIGILVGSVAIAGIVQLPLLGIIGIAIPETRSIIPNSWAVSLLVALFLVAIIGIVWLARDRSGE